MLLWERAVRLLRWAYHVVKCWASFPTPLQRCCRRGRMCCTFAALACKAPVKTNNCKTPSRIERRWFTSALCVGYVAIYNRLKKTIVDALPVAAFHSRLADGVRAAAKQGLRGWQDLLSWHIRTSDISAFRGSFGWQLWRTFLMSRSKCPSSSLVLWSVSVPFTNNS